MGGDFRHALGGRAVGRQRHSRFVYWGWSALASVVESQLDYTRAAVPPGRDDGGSVKRAIPRVLMFSTAFLLATFLFASFFNPCAIAQTNPDEPKVKDDVKKDTPGTPIKPSQGLHMDVDLALVNVTVTDPYNPLVTGLDPANFLVFEYNIQQEVVPFSSEDLPISIGVVFDVSGTMPIKNGKA